MKSATMGETTLLSQFDGLMSAPESTRSARKYRHGQHNGARVDGTFGRSNLPNEVDIIARAIGRDRPQKGQLLDDHHSPLLAEEYLQLRVRTQLSFYQRKHPKHVRSRMTYEFLLNATTIAGVILAFVDLPEWAPLAAASATGIAAWSKFTSVDTKLQRYADAITSIDNMLRWWKLLGSVEKVNLGKVYQLISGCEEIFATERQGWVSTAMSVTMGGKGGDADDDEKRGGGEKGGNEMPPGI